jgi:oligopeptide/dipeptide ABC transporter ATP-binding protein
MTLLQATGIAMRYPVNHGGRRGHLHAVDDVDLSLAAGECLGIVGESGCGKSTLARILARLIQPTAGDILFDGQSLSQTPVAQFWRSPARARIQMVFQDPTESLAPHMTASAAVADPIRNLLRVADRADIAGRVARLFDLVGLPQAMATRYPHQLSGGQKARVGIARALAVEPKLLVLDEPTAALDVSVQSVILRLLVDLKAQLGVSYIFVSHDLNVVRLLCDRIAVMYLGKIVETAPAAALFARPAHPYTKALLAAIPDPARRDAPRDRLQGTASSPIDPSPQRCRLAGRCPVERDACTQTMPTLRIIGDGHFAACHFAA